MNKPFRPDETFYLPPTLVARLQTFVDQGVFESVGQAVFVAAGAFADCLEFDTSDHSEAITRSIERDDNEVSDVDAFAFLDDLAAKYRAMAARKA